MFEKMLAALKKIKANYIVDAVLCIAVGVALLAFSAESVDMIVRLVGVAALIEGAVLLLKAHGGEHKSKIISYTAFGLCVALIVLGLLLILLPDSFLGVIHWLLGIIAIINGVGCLLEGVNLVKGGSGAPVCALALGFAVVSIVVGVLVITSGFDKPIDEAAAVTIVRVIAGLFIVNGLVDLGIVFLLHKKAKAPEAVPAPAVEPAQVSVQPAAAQPAVTQPAAAQPTAPAQAPVAQPVAQPAANQAPVAPADKG